MSHMDEPTLEFFVEDSMHGDVEDREEKLKAIVALLEPEREWIESRMADDYDEQEHSWRGYRNGMWCSLEEYDDRVDEIWKTVKEKRREKSNESTAGDRQGPVQCDEDADRHVVLGHGDPGDPWSG